VAGRGHSRAPIAAPIAASACQAGPATILIRSDTPLLRPNDPSGTQNRAGDGGPDGARVVDSADGLGVASQVTDKTASPEPQARFPLFGLWDSNLLTNGHYSASFFAS